jgi:hypothetical protein
VKVCCSNGKPYDSLTDFERLGGCSTDQCVGPIEVEDFDLLLTGLGTFDPKDIPTIEDLLDFDRGVQSAIDGQDIRKAKLAQFGSRLQKEIDLLTVCGTFNTDECISHEDFRHLFNKSGSWEQWILSQIEQEGVEKYKAWYARMSERCDLHSDLIEAHNKLFGEKDEATGD